MNPYLRLAYNTAREFARRDSCFCISQKKPLAQGKNNCTILSQIETFETPASNSVAGPPVAVAVTPDGRYAID